MTLQIKYLLLSLTLCCSHFFSLGQQSKIDSLQNILKTTTESSGREDIRHALYKELVNEADKQYDKNKFEQSAPLYEQAFAINPKENINIIYNAACSWARFGNKENAFNDLKIAIDNGWSDITLLKTDKDLFSLHNEKEWTALLTKLQADFSRKESSYFWGVFFGIMFILFLYNLFLFLSIKDISLFYYALFIFFCIHVHMFSVPEFGNYLVKVFPWVNYTSGIYKPFNLCVSIMMIFYLLFVRSFLNLKVNFKIVDKWMKFLIAYSIFTSIISIRNLHMPGFFFKPHSVLIVTLFIFVVSIWSWIKGNKSAKYFVLANTALTVGFTLAILNIIGIINISFKIYIFSPDQIGFVVFLALLSFALGDKINTLKIETIMAQEKALVVLEEKVQERTIEVVRQKEIIEEKNKDITDSINYAKRIQQAKLPDKKEIYSSLPQSFVLFKPKDIVSGDFYFFHKNVQSIFIASADCTGHGVPGAFMSLIGSEKLDDAVEQSIDTSEILKLLNKGIKTSLKQSDSDESTRDGMDIALCHVDTVNRIVKYAGANRPIWIIRNGQTTVEEIKATKKAIGGLTEDNQHFNSHEIKFQQGDTFYIFSDGYADTFSGQGGKKLTTKKFKEILLGIQNISMQDQELHLDNFIENWKSGTEQVDDILVIGVRM